MEIPHSNNNQWLFTFGVLFGYDFKRFNGIPEKFDTSVQQLSLNGLPGILHVLESVVQNPEEPVNIRGKFCEKLQALDSVLQPAERQRIAELLMVLINDTNEDLTLRTEACETLSAIMLPLKPAEKMPTVQALFHVATSVGIDRGFVGKVYYVLGEITPSLDLANRKNIAETLLKLVEGMENNSHNMNICYALFNVTVTLGSADQKAIAESLHALVKNSQKNSELRGVLLEGLGKIVPHLEPTDPHPIFETLIALIGNYQEKFFLRVAACGCLENVVSSLNLSEQRRSVEILQALVMNDQDNISVHAAACLVFEKIVSSFEPADRKPIIGMLWAWTQDVEPILSVRQSANEVISNIVPEVSLLELPAIVEMLKTFVQNQDFRWHAGKALVKAVPRLGSPERKEIADLLIVIVEDDGIEVQDRGRICSHLGDIAPHLETDYLPRIMETFLKVATSGDDHYSFNGCTGLGEIVPRLPLPDRNKVAETLVAIATQDTTTQVYCAAFGAGAKAALTLEAADRKKMVDGSLKNVVMENGHIDQKRVFACETLVKIGLSLEFYDRRQTVQTLQTLTNNPNTNPQILQAVCAGLIMLGLTLESEDRNLIVDTVQAFVTTDASYHPAFRQAIEKHLLAFRQ